MSAARTEPRNRQWIVSILLLLAVGCAGTQQSSSHARSYLIAIPRLITLYDDQGEVLRQWVGNYNVEIYGSTARFMDRGKAVIIAGTFVIEEQR